MLGNAPSSPASIPWREVWPGVMTSVLVGKPKEEGSRFVLLCRTSVPLMMETHCHRAEEHVTVLFGSLELGLGETSGEPRLQTLGPGSYAVIPAGVPHFMRYTAGTIVQIHGFGPFESFPAA